MMVSDATDRDQTPGREPDINSGDESPTVWTLLEWDNPEASVMPMEQE